MLSERTECSGPSGRGPAGYEGEVGRAGAPLDQGSSAHLRADGRKSSPHRPVVPGMDRQRFGRQDYRYLAPRATLTIVALIDSGYLDAVVRGATGCSGQPPETPRPEIHVRRRGERRLLEFEVEWLDRASRARRRCGSGKAAYRAEAARRLRRGDRCVLTRAPDGLEASEHDWQHHPAQALESLRGGMAAGPTRGIWRGGGQNRPLKRSRR